MGLTRSSSGLVYHDDFGSDTSGAYNPSPSGATFIVTGGKLQADVGNWTKAVYDLVSGVKCVSAVSTLDMGLGLYTLSQFPTDPVTGYHVFGHTDGMIHMERLLNTAGTYLNQATATRTQMRLYVHAAGVVARSGATSLAVAITSDDTTYRDAVTYGGISVGATGSATIDDFDLRTSHLVTCSGLPTGWKFQVTDGTTTATATESSGTATVDAGAVLFPLAEVRVLNGADAEQVHILAATLADMGGGDVFAYAADSSTPIHLLRPHIIPAQIGGL